MSDQINNQDRTVAADPAVAQEARPQSAQGNGGAAPAASGIDGAELAGPVPPPLTAKEYEELKAKAAKADEYWDRYLRMAADYDNFKKRATRERQDAVKYANEALLEKLVSVMDHFDMALAAANSPQVESSDSIKQGVGMIYQQLRSVLTEAGLSEIDATNQAFDPNLHHAVSSLETAEAPENQVVQQLRKGYKLRDRLLRPANVVVAKKPAA